MREETTARVAAYLRSLTTGAGTPTATPAQTSGLPALANGRILRLLRACLGEDLAVFPDGRMLIWDIARHDGYNIPPYPMAGCGDVKEFLRDEDAHDVPSWYEGHLGIPRETYDEIYRYELVMVRNRARYRRVWLVASSTMVDRDRLGGELARCMGEWATFAMGAQTSAQDVRLFKR